MLTINELNIDGWEKVFHAVDDASGLDSYIGIHNTKLGPALGGLRHWCYDKTEDALTDVLRLSEGMTYKNALSGIPYGGGKAVINGKKTNEKLKSFAKFVNEVWEMGGRYFTAEDVGTNVDDMFFLGEHTNYLFQPGLGEPSPATALGVFKAMQAALKFDSVVKGKDQDFFGMRNRSDITVAIQGLGAVGYNLAGLCHLSGFKLTVADINKDACDRAASEFGAQVVSVDDILYTDATITAPCALGAILNQDSIPQMNPNTIICGSANNQLQDMKTDGELIKNRKMIYVPDFIANAGGVINVSRESGTVPTDFHVALELDLIYHNTSQCLIASKMNKMSSAEVALIMAKDLIS